MHQHNLTFTTTFFLSLFLLTIPLSSLASPSWSSVNQLIKQQKLTAATQHVDTLLKQAITSNDSSNWRKALIVGADYRIAQGKMETAVNFLRQQKWPQDEPSQLILNLYYAKTLSRYIQRYSWEIRQRETIKNSNNLDLKKMTQAQLMALTNKAYQRAWDSRLAWNNHRIDTYLQDGTFPKRIRGSLRDTITYLWISFLGNESLWSARHSNQTHQLNLTQLLSTSQKKLNPTDDKIHPLKRLAWLLANLEQWHLHQHRPEAAFEAARIRIQRLNKSITNKKDKQYLRHALQSRIQQIKTLPWSTMGYWTLATLLRQVNAPDALIKTKVALDKCTTTHTKSEGNKQCQFLLDDLLRTHISLQAMNSDGVKKRSIEVTYNNIETLYFRAWKVNLLDYMKKTHSQRQQLIKRLTQEKGEDKKWTVKLPPNKNYRQHRTFVTPPMEQLGYWIIVASTTPLFDAHATNANAIGINLSKLVATITQHKQQIDITVYQGESGQRVPKATVELWKSSQQPLTQKIATTHTKTDGSALFTTKKQGAYSLLIKRGEDTAILNNIYHHQQNEPHPQIRKDALTFTDRSIYRPTQTIQWKVVAYQNKHRNGNFSTLPNVTGWVELRDTNNKVVAKKNITTNAYGSASGTFDIKKGRMLGQWSIQTSWNSYSSIRIEEYKRPTFSVTIDDTNTALRLNQPANITGTARYYFGQKVTNGKVSWHVIRKPRIDWHWYRHRTSPNTATETIASGTSTLNDKGQFSIAFLPQGDKRLQHIDYIFEVKADITNAGGETRSAKRSYRLGNLAIKASIETKTTFGNEGKAYTLAVSRMDLNDTPRQGKAHWTLTRLQQPPQPILPADLPKKLNANQQDYATLGDRQTPRWGTTKDTLSNWKDGQQIRKGTLQHNASGIADITLKGLPAGAYRVHYSTLDQWQQRFTTQHDLIIAAKQLSTLQLPTVLRAKKAQVEVGQTVELLLGSGFKALPVTLAVYHGNKLLKRSLIRGGIKQLRFLVQKEHRGGLDFVLTAVKDFQILKQTQHISVPWTDRQLNVSFSSFRDKLQPGAKETWRITVKDAKGKPLEKGAAEVLASMYDSSLDFFSALTPPNPLSFYKEVNHSMEEQYMQNVSSSIWQYFHPKKSKPSAEIFIPTQLINHANRPKNTEVIALGEKSHTHPAIRGAINKHTHSHVYNNSKHQHFHARRNPRVRASRVRRLEAAPVADVSSLQRKLKANGYYAGEIDGIVGKDTRASLSKFMQSKRGNTIEKAKNNTSATLFATKVRSNFNETAFFFPHLVLEKDGSVSFEFEVPESLTQWNVWASAITRDLRSGTTHKKVKTSKTLMVRPYLPRFLREGDQAEINIVINNSSDKALTGKLKVEIFDPETEKSLADQFKLQKPLRHYQVAAGKSTSLRFTLNTPNTVGMIAIRAKATAGTLSDGEQRPLAILPSRLHLTQSRFTALHNNDPQILTFKALANNNDPTRINDKLVVTVEGQLFYSVLNALPYLVEYPYECTEQTLNRYLSTTIVKSVFDQHPTVSSMAKKLAKRNSRYPAWNKHNANRSLLLEETPWLAQAEGGAQRTERLFNILDPAIANTQRKEALSTLRKAQTTSGGFPWWSGGRASPYMTLYMLQGFSRALEFNAPVPKKMVQKAWKYLHNDVKGKLTKSESLHTITFINYLLSAYPDPSWTGTVFSRSQRDIMLAQSFKHWQQLPALLKSYLALTLHRAGKKQQAALVFDSIMDSAKTDPQLGTYWTPEDRAWLWYNDTVDTHAFILRTLTELNPTDLRRQGIIQWLLLNKKLNHWKSTRATAESIYALVHYLKHENQLAIKEKATVKIGTTLSKEWVFKPDEYTGHNNQLIVEGGRITPEMGKITVNKESNSLMFASATWHFSTEKIPQQASGNFFQLTRTFYKRIKKGQQWILQPLTDGIDIAVGDQLEVQLSLRSKHNAEYIHLRSPRAAGYEPIKQTSGYQWQSGMGYYEEIRDSGTNYFFERLPMGEYRFKYHLRATTAGVFRTAPARVQSIYSPDFIAYSSGQQLKVSP